MNGSVTCVLGDVRSAFRKMLILLVDEGYMGNCGILKGKRCRGRAIAYVISSEGWHDGNVDSGYCFS